MSNSSDAAEQLVHTYIELYLEGTKVALNISGKATKNIIKALYSLSKEQKKTKGQIRLSNMIKSGKELTIFPVARDDLKKFTEEAKRYGVLYSTVIEKNKTNKDGMVDIMVRTEDASKIDRIVRRFNIQTLSKAEIKSEILKTKEENLKTPNSPSITKSAKENQLENSFENKKNFEGQIISSKETKTSVRQELKTIKEDLEKKSKEKSKEPRTVGKNTKKKKTKKTKERA